MADDKIPEWKTNRSTEPDKLRLVRGLNDRTRAGRLHWGHVADGGPFVAHLAGQTVEVFEPDAGPHSEVSPQGSPWVQIRDSSGDVIDSITPHSWEFGRAWNSTASFALMDLYAAARASAMGASEVVGGLLDALEGDGA